MALKDKQKINYYRKLKKERTKKIILANARKRGHVVYGARAVNKQLRKPLQKPTEDYDIYTKTPEKTAKRVERKLDKKHKGDFFYVKEAIHPGTYKLISQVTKKGVADYSKAPEEKVKTIKRKGIKYAHLSHQLKNIKKSLKDPKSKFRHDKDRETRQRIKLNKKFKAKRKRKTATLGTLPSFWKGKSLYPSKLF